MQQAIDILKTNNLSITDSRTKILAAFLKKNYALAYSDMEKKFKDIFDRATIYRTLSTFIEKGIIHSIPTSDNISMYALCKNECTEHHHHDEHVHFICNDCGETTCLDKITIPKVKLPKGYKAADVKMIVSGQCEQCN